ncbi:BrnT family toxin [Rhodopseudomonas boonkerdii]|nr:BrnT family toxin [Rhodopseudomonas boonkerdii]
MSDFDPAKEAKNREKHHISLERWIDIDMKITYVDGIAYYLVFTIRDGLVRPISLRRAHAKEMRRYVP